MTTAKKRLEFRIPISPTESFFAQVRFFNFALRRLGPPYDQARLRVVVGNNCDIDQVRSLNRWSEGFNVVWEPVPTAIFNEFDMWGTADWRLCAPAEDAEIICLSDADTVLLRDIDPLVSAFPMGKAVVRGHMAHLAPPCFVEDAPSGKSPEFWPWLFNQFGAAWPDTTYRYSMDTEGAFPRAPAYFNLGFVALSPEALSVFGGEIFETERKLRVVTASPMRPQLAVTIMAYRARMDIATLPAQFNAANDMRHLAINYISGEDIRVLHYLRLDEIDRSAILLPQNIDDFLARSLINPANVALQTLVREYRRTLP